MARTSSDAGPRLVRASRHWTLQPGNAEAEEPTSLRIFHAARDPRDRPIKLSRRWRPLKKLLGEAPLTHDSDPVACWRATLTSRPLQSAAKALQRSQNEMVCGCFYCVFVASCAASVTLQGNANAMSIKYEDNFGFYYIDDDDPEELEFFCNIRTQSGPTICARWNHKVRLQKHIKICATCSQALEYGAPSDPAWVVPNLWPVGE
jgi:hypothetical protein